MLSKHARDNVAQEMLVQSAQIYFCRETSCFKYVWQSVFNWVLYHWTVLGLFVQCWLGSLFTNCGTIMNRGWHWLEQWDVENFWLKASEWFYYVRNIKQVALCWKYLTECIWLSVLYWLFLIEKVSDFLYDMLKVFNWR